LAGSIAVPPNAASPILAAWVVSASVGISIVVGVSGIFVSWLS
jgi:uncharacterized membrane protein (DUF485 family)